MCEHTAPIALHAVLCNASGQEASIEPKSSLQALWPKPPQFSSHIDLGT